MWIDKFVQQHLNLPAWGKRDLAISLLLLNLLLLSTTAHAQTPANTSLSSLTDAAEARLQTDLVQRPETWVSSWLAAAPTVSIAALKSQADQGTDELELALSLPLTSPSGHQLNQQWQSIAQHYQQQLLKLRRWYASGQVRNLVWTIAQHQQQQQLLQQQLQTYQGLMAPLQQQAETTEVDTYFRYGLQQAQTQLAMLQLEHQQHQQAAEQQLMELTGTRQIPTNLADANPTKLDAAAWQQHPQLALLQLHEQQLYLQQQQNLSGNTPWQVTTRFKRIDTAGISENQIGLQLDIPLSLGAQLSQTEQSNYQISQQQWLQDYQQSRQQIIQQYQQAQAQLSLLEAQYQMLQPHQQLRQQAQSALLLLLQRQEINPDIAQQRLQQLFAEQRQVQLLKQQIQQAYAQLQQAAGVPL